MMNCVYLLDAKTQKSYALYEYEDPQEALDEKDRLKVEYPENLFYFRINVQQDETFWDIEQALLSVNGKDIYGDVHS